MLSQEQIEALLKANHRPRLATEDERLLLKNYLAQQVDEETQKMVARFEALTIMVDKEFEQFISFTWHDVKQQGAYELSDAYFATISKIE